MANNFNLGVDEDDIKKLLEQLKLEQECIAEEETKEKRFYPGKIYICFC